MKIKTSEIIGEALDWAVAKCEGFNSAPSDYVKGRIFCYYIRGKNGGCESFYPSTNWAQGGQIIEREGFAFEFLTEADEYNAYYPTKQASPEGRGETHLIAAMRCYIASKLGQEVDIPQELL